MIDLVGVAEIAQSLEVTKATVSTWRERGLLPRPVATLACGPIWRAEDVTRWANSTGRGAMVRRGEVSAQDLRDAVAYLDAPRTQTVSELRHAVDSVSHLLANKVHAPSNRAKVRDMAGRIRSNDGRGNGVGEFDWYWMLAPGERARLRRHMTDAPSALDPDQVASAVGSDDVETTMTEWARATRLLDALRSVERGKSPTVDVETETTYDAAELFGPDAIDYLARELSAEREGSTFSVARVIATYDQLEEAF